MWVKRYLDLHLLLNFSVPVSLVPIFSKSCWPQIISALCKANFLPSSESYSDQDIRKVAPESANKWNLSELLSKLCKNQKIFTLSNWSPLISELWMWEMVSSKLCASSIITTEFFNRIPKESRVCLCSKELYGITTTCKQKVIFFTGWGYPVLPRWCLKHEKCDTYIKHFLLLFKFSHNPTVQPNSHLWFPNVLLATPLSANLCSQKPDRGPSHSSALPYFLHVNVNPLMFTHLSPHFPNTPNVFHNNTQHCPILPNIPRLTTLPELPKFLFIFNTLFHALFNRFPVFPLAIKVF